MKDVYFMSKEKRKYRQGKEAKKEYLSIRINKETKNIIFDLAMLKKISVSQLLGDLIDDHIVECQSSMINFLKPKTTV